MDQKVCSSLRVGALLLAVIASVTFVPAFTYADSYLVDSSVAIVQHHKRQTTTTLSLESDKDPSSRWGLLFTNPLADQEGPNDEVSYTALPECKSSEVQLKQVFHHTPNSERFNVLYYDAGDPQQLRRVKQYHSSLAVAYKPSLMRDSRSGQIDRWQVFARFIQIKCLPSRFRFIYIGSQRYIEHRTGENAWKE